jgi:hypothetical protein
MGNGNNTINRMKEDLKCDIGLKIDAWTKEKE